MDKKKKKVEEIKKEIPEEIKVLFGKFYVFSFIYILFFLLLLPLVLAKHLNKVFLVLLFFWLIAFYVYMVIDVNKKRKNFTSSIFVFLIFLVVSSVLFSIVKIFF